MKVKSTHVRVVKNSYLVESWKGPSAIFNGTDRVLRKLHKIDRPAMAIDHSHSSPDHIFALEVEAALLPWSRELLADDAVGVFLKAEG